MNRDEAVEAAQRAIREHEQEYGETCFCGDGECFGSCPTNLDEHARLAVEAATRFIKSAVLKAAADRMKHRRVFDREGNHIPAEVWLRAEAGD